MEPLSNNTNQQTTRNTYLSAIVQRSLDELIRAAEESIVMENKKIFNLLIQ